MPTCEQVKDLIQRAESALGPLDNGQRTDLLLDNFLDIIGREGARLWLAECGELK